MYNLNVFNALNMKFVTNIAVADSVKSLARAIVAANSVLIPALAVAPVAAVAFKAAIPAYPQRAASAAVLGSANTAGVLAGALFLNSPAYPAGTGIPAFPLKPATAAVPEVPASAAVPGVLAIAGIKAFATCFSLSELGADTKLVCKIPLSAKSLAADYNFGNAIRVIPGSALLTPTTKVPGAPAEPSVTPSSLEKFIYNLAVAASAKMSLIYENDNYFLKCEVTAVGQTITTLLADGGGQPN